MLESTHKALPEESYQEKFEAGLTALNCTATRVPINSDKAFSAIRRACAMAVCVFKRW